MEAGSRRVFGSRGEEERISLTHLNQIDPLNVAVETNPWLSLSRGSHAGLSVGLKLGLSID